jgi:Mn2+/Fe2+ NRAMP family transporter
LQADGVVEDKRGVQGISRRNADIITGMVRSNLAAFFIIVATGAVLHSHHSAIKTAADAAHALEPAGHAATVMFLADVAVFYQVATEGLPS